jgi:hypothetical protein
VRSFRAPGGWKPVCICARHPKGAEQSSRFVRDMLAPRAGFENIYQAIVLYYYFMI